MQNRYVLFVFEVSGDSFGIGDFWDDFEGRSLFKDNLIARTRRFIDLFVCVNFERVVCAGHAVCPMGRVRRDTPLLTILTRDVLSTISLSARSQSIHSRPSFSEAPEN